MTLVSILIALALPIVTIGLLPKTLFAWKDASSRLLAIAVATLVQGFLFVFASTYAVFGSLKNPSGTQLLLPLLYDAVVMAIGLGWMRSRQSALPAVTVQPITRSERIASQITDIILVGIAAFILFALVSGVLEDVYAATIAGGWSAGVREILFPASAERYQGRRATAALFPILGAAFFIDTFLLPDRLKAAIRPFRGSRLLIWGSIACITLLYATTLVLGTMRR